MSVTAITISIAAIIILAISILFISQAREKARIEKIRKINTLQDRHRRFQRILDELPPQYLAKDIRILLLQRGIETLQQVKQLSKEVPVDAIIASDKEKLDQINKNYQKPAPVPINDEKQAAEVRKLLQILYKFIDNLRKKGKIEGATGKKYLAQIAYLSGRSKADYFVSQAKQATSSGKLRVAIHNYHSAIGELEKSKNNPLSIKAIQTYRAHIKQLEKAAASETSQKKAPAGEEAGKPLNKEWDKFSEDDATWKKKNAYDD